MVIHTFNEKATITFCSWYFYHGNSLDMENYVAVIEGVNIRYKQDITCYRMLIETILIR